MDENLETSEVVVPSIEDVAKEQGWKPKEEFDGDVSKWVSAETFVAKGELIEKIESLGKELKNTKKAMGMLQEHHKKVKETEFAKAVEYLKAQKKAAYEAGDVDAIVELDDKIAEVRETQKNQKIALEEETKQNNVHPEFSSWVSKNKWYDSDVELRDEADALGTSYAKRTGKEPGEVLKYVEEQIKKLHPDKFSNPNRNKPSTVEGSGTSGVTRKVEDIDMSDEERQVMMTFVRANIMTKEQYIADLKALRGTK